MKKIIETKTGGTDYDVGDEISLLSSFNRYQNSDVTDLALRLQEACFCYWETGQSNRTGFQINRIAFDTAADGNVIFRPVFMYRRTRASEVTIPYNKETVPKSIAAWCRIAENLLEQLGYARDGHGSNNEMQSLW